MSMPTPKRMRTLLLASLLLLLSVTPGFVSRACASPLDLYGFGSRNIAMGGAATAAVSDYGALFYNPGRMAFAAPGFGVHFTASFDDVRIHLRERPAGYDVPLSVYNALPLQSQATKMAIRYLATADLLKARKDTTDDPNLYALTGGVLYDFGLDWFMLGAAFSLPLDAMMTAGFNYVDERAQFFDNRLQFQLLNRRARRPSALLGLGFRPLKWFGFGASVSLSGNAVADTEMFVPDALDQQSIHLSMDMKMKYDATFILGLHFEPLPWLGIGLAYREQSLVKAGMTNRLRFWNFEIYEGEPITVQEFDYAGYYSPRQLCLGLRFDVRDWTFSTDLTWAMWSGYRTAIREQFDTGYALGVLVEDGKPYYPLSDMIRDPGNAGFRDTLAWKLGVEYRPLTWLTARVGGGYIQTPVPKQDGRTNYVDNNKVETAFGMAFHLPWVEGLSLEFHTQFLILIARNQWKSADADNPVVDEFPDSRDYKTDLFMLESRGLQTNNPGWPGYRSSGFAGTAGGGLQYRF